MYTYFLACIASISLCFPARRWEREQKHFLLAPTLTQQKTEMLATQVEYFLSLGQHTLGNMKRGHIAATVLLVWHAFLQKQCCNMLHEIQLV